MRALSLENIAPLVDGHVDFRRKPLALQPIRIPLEDIAYCDPFTRWVATCAAGVRLRFASSTRSLRFTATQRLAAEAPGAERRGAYDLFVDGQFHERSWGAGGALISLDSGALVGDEALELTFGGLPDREKLLELWFPQAATVSITGLELDDAATVSPAPDARPRVLFHGSSISHCMEAQGASAGWPAVAAGLAGLSHQNLGWAGSCLLSGLAARTIRDAKADAIILKLGINVWSEGMLKSRTFLDSAHAMISIIREKHPTTPIVIISPIFSPGREDAGDGLTLRQMRTLLQEVTAARVKSGDANIRYLSGLDLFGEADAAMLPDDLHPNTQGYALMGQRFCDQLLRGPGAILHA